MNEIKSINKIIVLLVACILIHYQSKAQVIADGEKTFKTICVACHTIGKGKLVGPDLAGVNTRRTAKWLLSFMKSPKAMIASGDAIALKLFNDHNKIQMPEPNLTDAQIKNVLAFIKSKTAPPAVAKSGAPNTSKPVVVTKTGGTTPSTKTQVDKTSPAPVDTWIDAEFKIKSIPSPTEINPKDFNAAIWANAKTYKFPVTRQNFTYPNLQIASIDSITIKSVYRPNQIAFLFEWNDSSKNVEVDVDKFCDQIAVEFPLNTNEIPSYMMGNKDGMVHIVHWKAIWQEDKEKGYRDVQVMYPNMWVDVYPGLESYLDRSKRIYAQDITAEQIIETHSYGNMPGTYSHNPMSQIKRKEPVEEANAEGFGTITTQETQQAKAWGEWSNGKWKVCVVVPVNTGNIYKATFKDKTKVAFALWDGGFNNIGGRKHLIPWVDLILEK